MVATMTHTHEYFLTITIYRSKLINLVMILATFVFPLPEPQENTLIYTHTPMEERKIGEGVPPEELGRQE